MHVAGYVSVVFVAAQFSCFVYVYVAMAELLPKVLVKWGMIKISLKCLILVVFFPILGLMEFRVRNGKFVKNKLG